MIQVLRSAGFALAAASTVVFSTPAAAVITTFAVFTPVQSGTNTVFERVGADGGTFATTPSGATTPGETLVRFSFLQSNLASAFTNIVARFSLTSSTAGDPAVSTGPFLTQAIDTGRFSFLTTEAVTFNGRTFAAGTNLLSGTFADASLSGRSGGSSGSLSDSTAEGSALTFTSDILDFSQTTTRDFSLALTAANPVFSRDSASNSLNGFRATASGNFSADADIPLNAVPEPAAWGLLIVGFGVAGGALRRRRHGPRRVFA